MRRPFRSRLTTLALVCLAAAPGGMVAGCGSSEQPEAYPGQPINPPSSQDDLLDMMTGTGAGVASADTPAAPTASSTAAPTASPTAAPSASAAPTARPKQPKKEPAPAPKPPADPLMAPK